MIWPVGRALKGSQRLHSGSRAPSYEYVPGAGRADGPPVLSGRREGSIQRGRGEQCNPALRAPWNFGVHKGPLAADGGLA